jgi:hypothetical protein
VSSLVEAKTLADDYALTHKLIFLKNKKAGGVPNLNYVQNSPPSISLRYQFILEFLPFLCFSSIYFNLIFSCISISLICTVSTPTVLTNSKSSPSNISTSGCRKRDDQTHVEFSREKEVCLKSGSLLKKKLQLFNKLR